MRPSLPGRRRAYSFIFEILNPQAVLLYFDQMRVKTLIGIGCLCLVLVFGCSPFQPAKRNTDSENLPTRFSLYSGESAPEQQWWRNLKSPELERLIAAGLTDNLSLKETWARLEQSRALAVQAGASRYPDLTGEAGAAVSRTQSGSGAAIGSEAYRLGLVSSYEVDMWGRLQAQRQAAALDVSASQEDLHTAAITLAAEITVRWLGIISSRMQKDLLTRQLQTNETILELVQLRFRNAMVSALDVYQQKQLVENVLAELPLVEEKERLQMHELAVLLGKPPGAQLNITTNQFPSLPPLPPIGLPADLLAARPDIRAAGHRLEAADWQIAQARANRLPAITLTARARYGESDLDVLFDTWLLNLSASLTAPIIDGGSRKAEVDRTRAVAAEKLAAYRDTVLTAIKEVEDALVREEKQQAHIAGLQQIIATAQKALEEAGARYRNGIGDYLPVLTQLLSVQSLENNLILRQENRMAARVALHRALGGGWPAELLPAKAPQRNLKSTSGVAYE